MIELLRTRRSIRKYRKRPVDDAVRATLREALLRCPSSRGNNPWTFLFVDDPALLLHLSGAKESGSAFLRGAPLAIVVCGDERKSDVWVEDCSIAAIVAQLVAHSLGLGTCWIQIRNRLHSRDKTAEEHVRETLDLPAGLKVECIISVGYPAESRAGIAAERLDYGKIRDNRYS